MTQFFTDKLIEDYTIPVVADVDSDNLQLEAVESIDRTAKLSTLQEHLLEEKEQKVLELLDIPLNDGSAAKKLSHTLREYADLLEDFSTGIDVKTFIDRLGPDFADFDDIYLKDGSRYIDVSSGFDDRGNATGNVTAVDILTDEPVMSIPKTAELVGTKTFVLIEEWRDAGELDAYYSFSNKLPEAVMEELGLVEQGLVGDFGRSNKFTFLTKAEAESTEHSHKSRKQIYFYFGPEVSRWGVDKIAWDTSD